MVDRNASPAARDPSQETRLVERAIRGDADAFTRLYDAYVDAIYRFVFFRTGGDEQCAEDLTSQVFLKAWEKLGLYEIRDVPFGAWLFRIARNAVIDHYRVYRDVASLDSDDIIELKASQDVGEEVASKVDTEWLLRSLSELTGEQRRILTLKFIEGLSTQEIAQLTGKREGAIRALQMRGLQALAALMEKQHG